jgi:hypothetical protein
MSKRFDGYIPKEYSATMEKLSQILEKENLSFSQWVRQQAEVYVAAKEKPLEKENTPEAISTCEVCGGKAVHFGVKDDCWHGFCDVHFDKSKFSCYR